MTPMVLRGRFSLSQNCLIMVPRDPPVSPRFFYYQLHPCFTYQRAGIPDHMQPSLRISDLLKYEMASPPPGEQQAIAEHLDRQVGTLDSLTNKICDVIDRLMEFRTALISAAVTGKIDVRGGVEE
jgi:type I restriction enzyme S subunit